MLQRLPDESRFSRNPCESSSPLRYTLRPEQADVAQLVEQLTRNEQVSGSSPLVGSHEIPAKRRKMRSPDFASGLSFIGQYTSCTPTQVLHALDVCCEVHAHSSL